MAVIRKKTGNYLEDFRVGQVFRHKGGKTLNEGLFNAFTDFSMTTNPLREEPRVRAAARLHGCRPPGLVMNVVFSQTVEDISENARANLEYINMRFGAPVHLGDTLEAETTIVGVAPSTKDPDRGVVHVSSVGRNQRGEVVIAFERKVQIWKSDSRRQCEKAELEKKPTWSARRSIPAYDRDARLQGESASLESRYLLRGLSTPATRTSTRAAAW